MGNYLPNCQKTESLVVNQEVCLQYNGADITIKYAESLEHLKKKFS